MKKWGEKQELKVERESIVRAKKREWEYMYREREKWGEIVKEENYKM